MKLRIGVDLGGTNIASGIVDENYNIIRRISISTPKTSADRISDAIADSIKKLVSSEGINFADIDGIGIGAPGIVDAEKGVIDYVCNLPMRYYPLAAAVEERLGGSCSCRIKLENDASAAALGEMLAGAGRGMRDFMLVTLGTGVGGGIITDGKLLPSFNHAGGEIGHTVIVADGVQCACGRKGCAETYCSASALVRMGREAAAANGDKTVLDASLVEAKAVFDAADLGDAVAKSVLNSYFEYVAVMLANFINIFQPEAIAIGGGVSGAGEKLLAPLNKLIFPDMIYNRNQPEAMYTKLLRAKLGGDAGIIGAAFLDGEEK